VRVGEKVHELLQDHAVWNEPVDAYSDEPEWLWVCGACGYLDKETDDHPAMIVEDYIRNLQVKAWDKGYGKGRIDGSEFHIRAYGGLHGVTNKGSVNPYTRGELHE